MSSMVGIREPAARDMEKNQGDEVSQDIEAHVTYAENVAMKMDMGPQEALPLGACAKLPKTDVFCCYMQIFSVQRYVHRQRA